MSEEEIHVRISGQEHVLTPDNTTVFSFLGTTVLSNGMDLPSKELDHVFIHSGVTEDDRQMGTYIFRQNAAFQRLAGLLLQNNFPAVINMREVPDCDKNAWEKANLGDVNDYLPTGW